VATDGAGKESRCVVCGEPVEARSSADCNWCNGRFHLNQRNDVEAKDCGQVWIDEQYMALQFACNTCLAGETASATAARQPAAIREIPAAPPDKHRPRRRRYMRRA
jgi:hypothetical protein